MNTDFAALAGMSLVVAIVVPLVAVLILALILYMVIRDGVAAGLRKHQLWMDQRGARQAQTYDRRITPPDPKAPSPPTRLPS